MVCSNIAIACILAAGWALGPVGTAVSIVLPLLGVFALVMLLVTTLLVRARIAASVAILLFLFVRLRRCLLRHGLPGKTHSRLRARACERSPATERSREGTSWIGPSIS